MFIIYGEFNKVLSKTCQIFANTYPQKVKPLPNSVKQILHIVAVRLELAIENPLSIMKNCNIWITGSTNKNLQGLNTSKKSD